MNQDSEAKDELMRASAPTVSAVLALSRTGSGTLFVIMRIEDPAVGFGDMWKLVQRFVYSLPGRAVESDRCLAAICLDALIEYNVFARFEAGPLAGRIAGVNVNGMIVAWNRSITN